MDHLKNVKTFDEIYSNDFNEILIKTPPNLFRVGLIIFAICVVSVTFLSLVVTYDKQVEIPFIASYERSTNTVKLEVTTKQNIEKYLEQDDVIIEFETANQLSAENDKNGFMIDRYETTQMVSIDGEIKKVESFEADRVQNFAAVGLLYQYDIYYTPKEGIIPKEAITKGKLYLQVGKQRLYKMFF
ncbi:MAG: hypothetical protein P1U56_23040 [Saprospiraceae bacterium]|nr:hypothetical protein [Saprospiraceae bacterium]